MEKWPIGVFTSVDAGLGVKLEVAKDLGVPTIQLHAPHQSTRTPQNAEKFLGRLKDFGIKLTCVFGGFEGDQAGYGVEGDAERKEGAAAEDDRGAGGDAG